MDRLNQKIRMRLPAIVLLAATLLFWGFYDRYERTGPALMEAPSLSDATRVWGECTETNGHFTLSVLPGGKTASLNFRMPDATQYAMIRVRGRIKTAGVVEGKNSWNCARLLLIQYDKKNKWIPGHHGGGAEKGTNGWQFNDDIFEVDPRAAHVDLVIQQAGLEGTAEFDQLLAEPVRLRTSFNWWRAFFAVLWIGMAGLYFRRCRLHRRKLRVLILLNALAIVFGTMMPEKWIEDSAEYAKDEAARIIESSSRSPAVPAQPSAPASTTKNPPEKNDAEQAAIDQFNEVIGHVHGLGHYLLFASLCFLVYCSAALERQHLSHFAKVAVDILIFAAVTESLQHLTLDRTPGICDWLTDFYGMLTALLLFLLLKGLLRLRSPARMKRVSF